MTDVLVVDDQALIRQAVTDILSADPAITVVGQASDGAQAVEHAQALLPDVILMDIRMTTLDGIEATRLICADPALSEVKVLILTTFEEDDYVAAALHAGASGFIGKGAEPEDIAKAVLAVHSGDSLLSPAATKGLIARYLSGDGAGSAASSAAGEVAPEVAAALSHLTEREREVLVCVGRGLSNQEIAAELFISPHTAKTHVNRIMSKVHAHDRAQLVILAYEGRLLVPGE